MMKLMEPSRVLLLRLALRIECGLMGHCRVPRRMIISDLQRHGSQGGVLAVGARGVGPVVARPCRVVAIASGGPDSFGYMVRWLVRVHDPCTNTQLRAEGFKGG